MYIKKIKLEKFKSFYDKIELDFESIKGLWKISGSVGAGKTSIGEAILFALFGTISGKNNGDLVSWGNKTAKIELWCRSNNRDIYIKREIASSGSSNIYVEIDGEELVFTNKKDAQRQLEEEYYDVSRVTMELLCIISFNNFKSLATLNTGETKKFLDQVLGFYILTQYSDVVKQLKHENEQTYNVVNNKLSNINAQIQKLEEITNMEIVEGNINDCNSEIANIDNQLKEFKSKYEKQYDVLNHELMTLRSDQTKIKTLGATIAKEIKFIENGTCPTCGAPIDQSHLEDKKSEREILLNQYNEFDIKIADKNKEISSLKSEYEKSIKPLNDKRIELRDLYTTLKTQANRANVNQGQIDKLNEEKTMYENELNSYKADMKSWDMLYNIISNDVRASILEKFIPALNSNIMKYSTELHQPYIISFDRQFKCSVSLAGYNDNIPISSLSTGQLKTVDMIIILGTLGTIIGSSSANIIFLDELFSNLDNNLRNEMCSVLHRFISENDTMFVISHQDLDERYFTGTLKLHVDNKGQFEKHSSITLNYNSKE